VRQLVEPFDGSLTANWRHSETKASGDELCGCGGKRRREAWPSPHAAAVRAELRSASSRSEHEPTSVRSRRYGSGRPVRVFHHSGCTFSWPPASLCATWALGGLDCAAGVRDRGTLPEKHCLTRLLQRCDCLPDGEHDALIRPHATTPLSKALRCSIHALVAGVRAVRSKDLRRIGFHRSRNHFNRVSSSNGRQIERLPSPIKRSATAH
jgi:hypothetical protein